MNKKILAILFGLILIKASFALVIDAESPVYGEQVSVILEIYNNDEDTYCYDLYARADTSDIDVDIYDDDYCLAGGSKTTATVYIDAEEADQGYHKIYIYEDGEKLETIEIYKDDDRDIKVWASSTTVSADKRTYIFLNLENETSRPQEVSLSADNEMLMPYFEDEHIILDDYEEKRVKLYVNTYGLQEGTHNLRVKIKTEYSTIYKTIKVKVSDYDYESDDFYIKTAGCFNLKKDEEKEIWFKLVNQEDYSRTIYLSISGDSDLDIDYPSSVKLKANQTKYVYLDVEPDRDIDSGTYKLKVKAWDYGNEERAELCVRVGKEMDYSIDIPKYVSAEECSTEVIPIEIENIGDRKFKVSLDFDGMDYKLSRNNFYIQEDDSEIVYLAVVPDKEGLFYTTLEIEIDGEEEDYTIEIDVGNNSSSSDSGELQLSYPKKLVLEDNKANIEVTLLNLSDKDEEYIMTLDLPNEFFYHQPSVLQIGAGETKTIRIGLEFDGEPGAYHGNFTIGEEEYPITIVSFDSSEEAGILPDVNLTGFFGIAQDVLLGLFILVIALLLIGAFYKNEPREVWLKR